MCSTKKQIDTWTLGDTILADNFENSNKKKTNEYRNEAKLLENMLRD